MKGRGIFAWMAAFALVGLAILPAIAGDGGARVDIKPLVDSVFGIAASAIAVLGTWLIGRLLRKVGVDTDGEIGRRLLTAAENGVGYGLELARSRINTEGMMIDVRNQVLADAAEYVVKQVPGAVAHFKLDDVGLRRILTAQLGQKVPAI